MKEYFKTDNNLIGPSVLIGIFLIVVAFIVSGSIQNIASKSDSISVTGSAERFVKADTGKMTVSVSERAYGDGAGLAASKVSARSMEVIKNYLIKNGVQESEVTIQTSNLSPICELSPQGYENCSVGIKGQIANQSLIVDTNNVEKLKEISSKISTEISGVNMNNNMVEYYFNGLKDIRVEMLAEATKNARERADAVATAGGATVGNITSLSSGVFQVTQKNSVSVDDYGMYDTSSIDKKITATVKANFKVR